jgi:hypothetical protein
MRALIPSDWFHRKVGVTALELEKRSFVIPKDQCSEGESTLRAKRSARFHNKRSSNRGGYEVSATIDLQNTLSASCAASTAFLG